MRLFWHRSDLRATDNVGLASAASERMLPVFVFDDDVLCHGSPPRVAHMLDALAELRDRYRNLGGDLHVARGDPASVLVDLADEHGADRVEWNRDYSGLAQRRDEAVAAALEDAGVETASHHDAVLHEPGSITTNDGDPYAVYSYYWRKWKDRGKRDPVDEPDGEQVIDAPDRELPTLEELGFDEPTADVEPGGREHALERLESFCDGPIYRYDERRDTPAADATSHLSPHLRWGTIGIRETYAATEDAMADAPDDDARDSVETFRGELAWREFYTQVLYYNPEIVTENYNEYEAGIDWRDEPDEIAAWKRGETGYPIVDAGMRQLREEAWMHNRVRMIVASFLTKDLMADWRHGYAHFREHLVDHNTANDNGGWQWAASTGTDAQPYFRIFNPTTQGERYDSEAEYIREYVPELRDVDAEDVHSWPDLSPAEREALASDYPDPIVDHGERREQALAMFKRARGEDPEE